MILYIVTETEEKYRNGGYIRPKTVLEDCAGDLCLVIHYRQARRQVLRDVAPWAVVHSGSSTPFEDYDILKCADYRRAITGWPVAQLGICGGHQLMTLFHGGTVDIMRAVAEADPDLNPRYHPGEFKEWGVFPVRVAQPDPLFRGLGETFRVQQFHRSEVKTLGKGFEVIASSRDCRVQAMRHRHKPLYGVQFHPEEATDAYPDGFTLLRNFFRLARATRRG